MGMQRHDKAINYPILWHNNGRNQAREWANGPRECFNPNRGLWEFMKEAHAGHRCELTFKPWIAFEKGEIENGSVCGMQSWNWEFSRFNLAPQCLSIIYPNLLYSHLKVGRRGKFSIGLSKSMCLKTYLSPIKFILSSQQNLKITTRADG